MNVAILSESESDEAGVRILAEAVLKRSLEVLPKKLRAPTRGWTGMFDLLPAVFSALHWNPVADGLICVIDSDDSTPHTEAHEAAGYSDSQCRHCRLHQRIQQLRASLRPRTGQPLLVAIGLAVPAIEAWYLHGIDIHSTESHFQRESPRALTTVRRQLKISAYGSVAVPQRVLTAKAIDHCTRIATDIGSLQQAFPSGFGTFARSLRLW